MKIFNKQEHYQVIKRCADPLCSTNPTITCLVTPSLEDTKMWWCPGSENWAITHWAGVLWWVNEWVNGYPKKLWCVAKRWRRCRAPPSRRRCSSAMRVMMRMIALRKTALRSRSVATVVIAIIVEAQGLATPPPMRTTTITRSSRSRRTSYIVRWRAESHRRIWRWDRSRSPASSRSGTMTNRSGSSKNFWARSNIRSYCLRRADSPPISIC